MEDNQQTRVVNLWDTQPPAAPHRMVLADKHRFIVLVAGRKFRKTTVTVNKLVKAAMTSPFTYPYIAPFRKQAKEIVWYDHVKRLIRLFDRVGFPYKKNDSELFIEFPLSGGRFKVDGSDNEEALRGIGNWGGMGLSEYGSWKDDVWIPVIRPNLITTKAWVIFEGTPKGFNHFHRMAKLGDHAGSIEAGGYNTDITPDPDFITYRFSSYDNPYLDQEEIEAARRISTPEFFAQEYLARFTKYTGLVHKGFSRELHLIDPFVIPSGWRVFRGWDFGSSHPTATLRIFIDNDGNWFIDRVYKSANTSIDGHSTAVKEQDGPLGQVPGFGDPSGAQWIREFNLRGLSIRSARKDSNTSDKNWVQLGIDKINEKLAPKAGHLVLLPDGRQIEGAPSLFIFKTSENMTLVEELETLQYKESQIGVNNADIDDTKDPKGHYDLHAALRYAIVSEGSAVSWASVDMVAGAAAAVQTSSQWDTKDPDQRAKLELEADLAVIRQQRGW